MAPRPGASVARRALAAAVLVAAASRVRPSAFLFVGPPAGAGPGAAVGPPTSREQERKSRRRTALCAADAARFLPPLETLEAAEASAENGTFVVPCFPLRLQHAALPGEDRTLNIVEPRYSKMYNDLLKAGKTGLVVPRFVEAAGGTVLAQAAVMFHLSDIRDGPARSRTRFVCKHTVGTPVRIRRLLNPGVFADKSTYLLAECEAIEDVDLERSAKQGENELVEALREVVALRERTGDSMRRWELSADATGRPLMIDNYLIPTVDRKALEGEPGVEPADPGPEGFWHLAGLWQGYCERRMIALRQWGWRSSAEARQDLGRGNGDGKDPKVVEDLKKAYEADAQQLMEATSDLMTRLLQAGSHGERLATLREAAEEEALRLAAAGVIQSAVGGEPLA